MPKGNTGNTTMRSWLGIPLLLGLAMLGSSVHFGRRTSIAGNYNDETNEKQKPKISEWLSDTVKRKKVETKDPTEKKTPSWSSLTDFENQQDSNNQRASSSSFPPQDKWLLPPLPSFDKETHFRRHGQLIPKTLFKVFLSNTGEYSKDFLQAMQNKTLKAMGMFPDSLVMTNNRLPWAHRSWPTKNPGYDIRYFNLRQCREYLQTHFHPIFLRAFDCIEAFALKADFFRYAIVYREGGYYSDWKQECVKDNLLDYMARGNITWVSSWDQGFPSHMKAMQNNFFGATPQSPVLAEVLRIIFYNIQKRRDLAKETKQDGGAYAMTGTVAFGRAFAKFGNQTRPRLADYQAHWGNRHFLPKQVLILHKCYGCDGGNSQDWKYGNNYLKKYESGELFCPDGPSLLRQEAASSRAYSSNAK